MRGKLVFRFAAERAAPRGDRREQPFVLGGDGFRVRAAPLVAQRRRASRGTRGARIRRLVDRAVGRARGFDPSVHDGLRVRIVGGIRTRLLFFFFFFLLLLFEVDEYDGARREGQRVIYGRSRRRVHSRDVWGLLHRLELAPRSPEQRLQVARARDLQQLGLAGGARHSHGDLLARRLRAVQQMRVSVRVVVVVGTDAAGRLVPPLGASVLLQSLVQHLLLLLALALLPARLLGARAKPPSLIVLVIPRTLFSVPLLRRAIPGSPRLAVGRLVVQRQAVDQVEEHLATPGVQTHAARHPPRTRKWRARAVPSSAKFFLRGNRHRRGGKGLDANVAANDVRLPKSSGLLLVTKASRLSTTRSHPPPVFRFRRASLGVFFQPQRRGRVVGDSVREHRRRDVAGCDGGGAVQNAH